MSGALPNGIAAGLPLPLPQQPAPQQAAGLPATMPQQPGGQPQNLQQVEAPNGDLIFYEPEPTDVATDPGAHDENLVGAVDEGALASLIEEVMEGIEVDRISMSEYLEALREGSNLLGLKIERATKPFNGASGAIHPMLMISLIRWTSAAGSELTPPDGPAKARVWGDSTTEKNALARRKAEFLNYYLTVVDEAYYADCDRGFLALGLYGTILRKIYREPVTGQPRSRFLTPFDVIINDEARDLQSVPRITYPEQVNQNEMRRRQLSGYYADVELGPPQVSGEDHRAPRKVQGAPRVTDERFASYDVYEVQVFATMEEVGLGDRAEKMGIPDDLPLPWLLTFEPTKKIALRLERDWDEGDELYRRRDCYVPYSFHPGLGFWSWGLIHIMANTTDTASILWRQAINAVTLHSFPGGVRAKGAKTEASNFVVGPGEFPEIDLGPATRVQDAIMPMPYRDVPTSWAPLMEAIVQQGQALGNTTELQVGEARQDTPVGTAIALLERAMVPEAMTIRRAHNAMQKELRLIAKQLGRNKQARYPYMVDGQQQVLLGEDFEEANDVVPVSDPSIPTQIQRLSRSQAKLQLAMQSAGLMDMRAALQDMLETLGCTPQEIQKLMPPDQAVEPADPVTEFARVLTGQKIKAGPLQSHQAHLMAHIGQLQLPNLPPQIVQLILGHCGEHLAMLYAAEASAELGIQIVPGMPMPPEVEMQVSAAVAAVSDAIIEKISPLLGGAIDPAKAAELRVKKEELDYKHEELAFKREDAERKAEETSRQDAMEAIRTRAELEDAKAQRGFEVRKLIAEMLTEVLKQKGDQKKAGLALQQAGITAQAAEAGERVEALRTSQKAIELQQERERTAQHREQTVHHDKKVEGMREQQKLLAAKDKAAENQARRQAAAARRKPKGATKK